MTTPRGNRAQIHLLAVIEAAVVTGPAKNLLQFARLARGGRHGRPIEVSVATFERRQGGNEFVDAAADAGIRVHVIPERWAGDWRVIRELNGLIEAVRADLIQTHAVKSHFLLRLSGAWRRRPWVAFHHGYTTTSRKMVLYNQLDRWSLRAAQKVVTVSNAFASQLSTFGVARERICVLHNCIDLKWGEEVRQLTGAQEVRAGLGIQPGEQVLTIVGRLSKEKAHEDLVSAVKLIQEKRKDARLRLLVVGEGPERERIEARARLIGVHDRITFTGYVRDTRRCYAATDVAVLASRTEGSPNALLEAMAARIPVVATAVGGIPEMVTSGESALLVKPGSAEEMAEAIDRVLTDSQLAGRLVDSAGRLAAERHSPEARTRLLSEIYERTLASWNEPGI